MPLGSLSGKGLKTQEMASAFVEGRGVGGWQDASHTQLLSFQNYCPLQSLLPLSLPGLPPYSFLTAMCHPLAQPPRLQLSSLEDTGL